MKSGWKACVFRSCSHTHVSRGLAWDTYLDLIGQCHVDHVAEGVTDVGEDLVDGFSHGLEEELVVGLQAPAEQSSRVQSLAHEDSVAVGGARAPIPLCDAGELRALFK